MESILPGFSCDIFISYRQKDNKYDGWVTEFVDNLKRELEGTFKEEISVYFDINPSDYLLETYDVDASLKDKLKCLVFIPIISRTYCDPKAFAWEYEFKAYIEQASHDQFGLKIKLPNGNVTTRVLPVRINDLEITDIKLCESILGGAFRGIDFIYKSAGVNRPLRSKEENPHENLNHTIYRDQINKVALAIKDIIESVKVSVSPPDHAKYEEIKVEERDEKKKIELEKTVGKEIFEQKQDIRSGKIKPERGKILLPLRKPRIFIPGILVTLAFVFAGILLIHHHSKVNWAKEQAIPDINKFIYEGKFTEAFELANKADEYIPDDTVFLKLWPKFSRYVSIRSEPEDAKIYWKNYDSKDTSWIFLGETPADSIRVPYNFLRIKLEKQGFQTVYDVVNTLYLNHPNYILDKARTLPENMVHIPVVQISINLPYLTPSASLDIKDYLIDRYEVTNKEYKAFIDSGGYQKKQYWKQPIKKDGNILQWDEAMSLFVDKTFRPGPSTWEGGGYPDGEDNYPVRGVSWYEAAAYAEFAGKSLPTYYHWRRAAGLDLTQILPLIRINGPDALWGISFVVLKSNLGTKEPAPVGTYQGMTGYGTFDMIGNVREWCWNEVNPGEQRYILGAGWDDPSYLATASYIQSPLDRSRINGFRCAIYLHTDENLNLCKSPRQLPTPRDFFKEKPATDQQFEIYKRMYDYSKTNLNAVTEPENETGNYWIRQKISFDAAYGNERVTAYLYLPKSNKPPFQTIVYFPGSGVLDLFSSKEIQMDMFDYILKNGRAVLYPVYKGTYERRIPESLKPRDPIAWREYYIQLYRDMARSIDYLESRTDIDVGKIAYFGHSWGGRLGPLMVALDKRIKTGIFLVAGLSSAKLLPEADPFNYVHRVKIPVLMLNGKYDTTFPYETSQVPLFELLGTPIEDKRHFTFERGHSLPREDLVRETLIWLDKYLGPVNPQEKK